VGMYEEGYTEGNDALAKALAESNTAAVIGGGDTTAAISKFTFNPAKVFISSGGGAMLEFLANGTLPAIEVLKKA
jgi:phosphoglycerate kinase